MPEAHGYRYIVAARDDLSKAAEGRALRKANSKQLSQFFWEQIICRYGTVGMVVTDNGPEVKGAFDELLRRYGIPQVRISAYNSKANGVVERGHYDIRESIVKACEGQISHWPEKVHAAFFADRITIHRSTGFSPYFLLHGVHPVLPFDLVESTILVDAFTSNMPQSELLALRIRQLEKREDDIHNAAQTLMRSRLQSKAQFEKRYETRMSHDLYDAGTLVLIRNSAIEKELDRKSKPRYLGPYEIVRVSRNNTYVLRELNGAILCHAIASFRLLPYIHHDTININLTS